ncbi:ATP/GTP-binding protein [Hymenobacter sp. DG01]|uniref:AAA family ATPase n=1 Tax=Hymenobacter sp. DG01 TaxID=2584940 RepID=UPI0015DF81DE|nr:AAA family ATPase [Hymenobacter sp. DG01]
MMPDIIGLSDQYPDLLDTTYINLARKLTIRLKSEPPAAAQPVIQALGEAMGGTIKAENGRFYLQPSEGEAFEIGLVAEGFRKLGTLAYLLGNGTLTKETTLYWDEPEANLNPALLRKLAELLVQLAAQGFQIILATHSLFLLKEFHILSRQHPAGQVRYFGLNERPGKGVEVTATNDLEQLPDIAALDAELDLADRFQEVLDQEDADDN